jgi:hypothetical protein
MLEIDHLVDPLGYPLLQDLWLRSHPYQNWVVPKCQAMRMHLDIALLEPAMQILEILEQCVDDLPSVSTVQVVAHLRVHNFQ